VAELKGLILTRIFRGTCGLIRELKRRMGWANYKGGMVGAHQTNMGAKRYLFIAKRGKCKLDEYKSTGYQT